MTKLKQTIFLVCGLLLTLAVVPVFAQQEGKGEINIMPFKDFARNIKEQVETGKLDLSKSFSVELEGVLTKDGRLDREKSKFTKSEGDAAMITAGKGFIEAVSNSGILQHLQDLGVEKLTFAVAQNDNEVTAIIKSETVSAGRAKTMVSGLNMLFKMVAMQSKNEDDKALINYFNVTADNKNFIVNFAAPREAVHELLKKHLEKMAAKPSGE